MPAKEQMERLNRELLELLSAGTNEARERRFAKARAVVHQRVPFGRELSRETDRGCAVMARSILHEQLAAIIRNRLVQEPVLLSKLLGPHGLLASFMTRIDLAFALGLISKRSARTLCLLVEIASEFANGSREISFESPRVGIRCRELPDSGSGGNGSLRDRFLGAAEEVFAEIEATRFATTPLLSLEESLSFQKHQNRTKVNRLAAPLAKPNRPSTLRTKGAGGAMVVCALALAPVEVCAGSHSDHGDAHHVLAGRGEAMTADAAPAAAYA